MATKIAHVHDAPRHLMLHGLPPVLDQNSVGACAVNACANALTYAFRPHSPGFQASRMFLYYNTRHHVMKQRYDADEGCNLRDVCRAAAKFGVCDEEQWPYKKKMLRTKPPDHLYRAAKRLPPCVYRAVPQSLPHLVACLVRGLPVMIGMSVFSSMRDVPHDGIVRAPLEGDTLLGGHAALVCGYDLDQRAFFAQNCWGTRWGRHGFFTLPFEYVLNPLLCWDFWVLELARDDNWHAAHGT